MALAYRRPSIVEIFQAHLQARQKPHPPGLRSLSVSDPVQRGQTLVSLYSPEWVAAQEEYLAVSAQT